MSSLNVPVAPNFGLPAAWGSLLQLTVDFETYYDSDYNLRKMTVEEYVRDPRFQVTGLAIKVGQGASLWITGTFEYMRSVLARLPWERVLLINHNLSLFDSLILTEHFGLRAREWSCTQAMARALIGGYNSRGEGLSLAALAKRFGLASKLDDLKDVEGLRQEEIPPELMDRFGKYAVRDTDLARSLFDIMAPLLPSDEHEQISLFTRMFCEPKLGVDGDLASALFEQEKTEKERLIERTGMTRKQLGSTLADARNPLAQAFIALGVTPKTKVSPTTKKDTWAFAKDDRFMEDMLIHDDPRVRDLAEARIAVKSVIGQSRLGRLRDIASRGRLPVPLTYGRAITHRCGGAGKINLQNTSRPAPADAIAYLGQRVFTPAGYSCVVAVNEQQGKVAVVDPAVFKVITEIGLALDLRSLVAANYEVLLYDYKQVHIAGIRDVIVAQEGYTLPVCDSSNIELRVAHTLAGQTDTVALLRQGADLYCDFAGTLYKRDVTKADKKERLHGKISMLQLQYQSGWASFQRASRVMGKLYLDESECRSTVATYRSRFHKLPAFWQRCQQAIEWMYTGHEAYVDDFGLLRTGRNCLHLPNGMTLVYRNLRQEPDEQFGRQWVYDDKETGAPKRLYGGSLFENICQALARIVVFDQMLEIDREFRDYYKPLEGVALTVHDEVVGHTRKENGKTFLAFMEHTMAQPPKWWPELPVACEGDLAERYALAK